MDTLDMAQALKSAMQPPKNTGDESTKTTTVFGVARGNSKDGVVDVDLGGDTISSRDTAYASIPTNVSVKSGDSVMVQLVGADGTGKQPVVVGVQGGGDEAQVNTSDAIKKAEEASEKADDARKFADNYISFDKETGLVIGDQEDLSSGCSTHLTSDRISLYEGDVEVASFSDDDIEIGKNATTSTVSFCGGKGKLSCVDENHFILDNSDTSNWYSSVALANNYKGAFYEGLTPVARYTGQSGVIANTDNPSGRKLAADLYASVTVDGTTTKSLASVAVETGSIQSKASDPFGQDAFIRLTSGKGNGNPPYVYNNNARLPRIWTGTRVVEGLTGASNITGFAWLENLTNGQFKESSGKCVISCQNGDYNAQSGHVIGCKLRPNGWVEAIWSNNPRGPARINYTITEVL